MILLQITPEQQLYIGLGAIGVVILFLIIIFSNRAKHKARADTLEKVVEDKEKPVHHVEHKKVVVHHKDDDEVKHKTVVHIVKHKKADDDDEEEKSHKKRA